MNLTIAIAAAAAALGFAGAWQLQDYKITKMELDYADQQLTQTQSAFRRLERDMQKVAEATNAKAGRDAGLRRDADRADHAGNGLRIASTDAVRAAREDASACLASVALYDELLNEVVDAGGRMAAEADQWESDSVMLIDHFKD